MLQSCLLFTVNLTGARAIRVVQKGTNLNLMSIQMFVVTCITAIVAIGHPRKCCDRGVKDAIVAVMKCS